MASKRINFESGRDLQIDQCDRLRLSRLKAGIEQEEMAEILGISSSTVSNWENGKTLPKAAFLNAWAQVTGFNLSSLVGTIDESKTLAAKAKLRAVNGIAPASSGVSQLPRQESNLEPCGWLGPPVIVAVTPFNVVRGEKESFVCSWPPEETRIDDWYMFEGVSWTCRIPKNTMALWALKC